MITFWLGSLTTMIVQHPLGRHEAPSPQASDVLDRDGRSQLYHTSWYGARTSRHTRAQQSRCTRPALRSVTNRRAARQFAASPTVTPNPNQIAPSGQDGNARQCKVPLLYMPPTIGPNQRHSPLLTTTLNHADARRLCPRRLAERPRVAHGCLEWLWCRVGLIARHFTDYLTQLLHCTASSRLTTTTEVDLPPWTATDQPTARG
jgi:hypothetical protein